MNTCTLTTLVKYIIHFALPIALLSLHAGRACADDGIGISGTTEGEPVIITSPLLKVISLNLAHGRKDGLNQVLLGADTIRNNLQEIGTILRPLAPEVIALQEADGPSLWSGRFNHVEFLAHYGGFPYYANARHSSTQLFEFGTAFLSAVPLQDVQSFKFEPTPPTLRKGFLRVSIPWNPDNRLAQPLTLDLVSVHLDFSRRSVREKQATELIKLLSPRRNPLILMGDLNANWIGDEPTVRDIVHTLNLKAYKPHSTTLGTYRASGKRLDWILISDDFEFVQYEVLKQILSDHLAVSAHIAMK